MAEQNILELTASGRRELENRLLSTESLIILKILGSEGPMTLSVLQHRLAGTSVEDRKWTPTLVENVIRRLVEAGTVGMKSAPEQNIGTQILKTLVEHTINDITYEQMSRIVRRLQRMSREDRNAPQRVAEVLYEELGADKSLQYVEKAFANGMITATEYSKLRAILIFPKPRAVTVPPAAGIASQQLLAGQKRLQQDLGKIRDLGLKSLEKPMENLNKDIQRLRRAWGL